MRELTKEQKKLLTKWYKEKEPTQKEKMILGSINPLDSWENLSLEQIEKLEEINDTEILYQNVNNFLDDLRNN